MTDQVGREAVPLTFKDYRSDKHSDWCAGCGDFSILQAIQIALAKLQLPPDQVVCFSGVGCSAKTPHYLVVNGVHTLHGRALAFATGGKLSNKDLTVISIGGDGDMYGIGGGQLLAAGRRNVNITSIVNNNSVYGLTKGQPSPTFKKGTKTRHMAETSILENLNPLGVAILSGYTFVAKGYALDPKALSEIIAAGITHQGHALIDILQTCPVFAEDGLYGKDWAKGTDRDNQARVVGLSARGYDPKVSDAGDPMSVRAKKLEALGLTFEEDPTPIGIYYQIDLPTYEEQIALRQPGFGQMPLASDKRVFERDLTSLIDELR